MRVETLVFHMNTLKIAVVALVAKIAIYEVVLVCAMPIFIVADFILVLFIAVAIAVVNVSVLLEMFISPVVVIAIVVLVVAVKDAAYSFELLRQFSIIVCFLILFRAFNKPE